MKEYYAIPGLFEKFKIIQNLVNLLNNEPFIFRDNVVIDSVYGSNGTKLSGGRYMAGKAFDNDVEISSFFKNSGITPALVLTNLLATKEDIPDALAKRLLESFDGAHTSFVVANPLIECWLENEYNIGRKQFILSTMVGASYEQTISACERYGKIVLNEKFTNNFSLINTFPNAVKSKLEILVNSYCPDNCPQRQAHYKNISLIILSDCKRGVEYWECNNKERVDFLCDAMNKKQFVTLDKISAYLNMGINHFKIQGRTNNDSELIETLSYYLVKPEYQLAFRTRLRNGLPVSNNN